MIDLEEKREVSYEEGASFTENRQLDLFFETSASTGENINKVRVAAIY